LLSHRTISRPAEPEAWVPSIENEDPIFLEEWNRYGRIYRVSAAGAKSVPPGTSGVMPLNQAAIRPTPIRQTAGRFVSYSLLCHKIAHIDTVSQRS